jgi:hypothetical protein
MRNSADVGPWQNKSLRMVSALPEKYAWFAVGVDTGPTRCIHAIALCATQVQSACLKVTMLMLTCILMQEMDSIESAQQIMETDLRFQFNLDGAPLRLDYSHAAQPAAAVSASASSDWMCPGCSAVNFSR